MAGHLLDNPDRLAEEEDRVGSSGSGNRDSWAEQSESLYHSAQGSFGHSSTASSSIFHSAMQMDRSMACSRMHREALAEVDEGADSDADSFFSASGDGHHEDDRLLSLVYII